MLKMAKISIYINTRASQNDPSKWHYEFTKHLFRHDLTFKIPKTIKELKTELQKDINQSVDYIFSIGGDGTANLISQEIVHSDIKLMVIPCGTANDFATELGIEKNISKIITIFKHRTSKKVDLIKINNKYMFSNGGIGLAADVAEKVNSYRQSVPFFKMMMKYAKGNAYIACLVKEFAFHSIKLYKVRVSSPHLPNTIQKSFFTPMILINNQSMLGNKFEIAPETRNDDGFFNVSIFLHTRKKELIKAIALILKGQIPHSDPNFISFETDSFSISSLNGESLSFFGDGEILKIAKNLKITLSPLAIEVCTKGSQDERGSSHSLDEINLA